MSNPVLHKRKPDLGVVQETLLIPLWARAVEASQPDPILQDPKALEILSQIDYDFSRFATETSSQLSVCIRSKIIDRWVTRLIQDSPTATIVEIGAGLSTRFDRLDNGSLNWFDLDLPDAIAVRQHYLPEGDRQKLLAKSVFDPAWLDVISVTAGSPLLFIIEGLLVYFTEDQVKTVLAKVCERFPGSLVAFDATSPFMVEYRKHTDAIKHTGAKFQWGISQIQEIELWDSRYQILESLYLADFPQYKKRFSSFNRLAIAVIPQLLKMYGVHLVKLGAGIGNNN
ncbi:MAG TPA: class I SAM-dependent methyltransferase [Xenococcaceae cyanobacterium]|jgi:O-methyltransferase involved in polyketide biosynthesis